QLELARTHRLPHVDTGFGEPPEMVFPQIGVHEVESFVPPVKAVFDERAKHPVLLVRTVEKSANVTALAENAPGTSHGTAVRSHVSPPAATGMCQSQADASEQVILLKGLAQVTDDAGRERALPNAVDWLVIIALVRTAVSPEARAGTGQEEQRTDSPAVPLR